MSSHFLGSRAPICVTVAVEDICLNHKCSSLLSLNLLLLSMMSHGKEYLCCQSGSVVQATSSPSPLPSTSLLAFGDRAWGWRETLALWALLSSSHNTGILLMLFYPKMKSTALHIREVNSIPAFSFSRAGTESKGRIWKILWTIFFSSLP